MMMYFLSLGRSIINLVNSLLIPVAGHRFERLSSLRRRGDQ